MKVIQPFCLSPYPQDLTAIPSARLLTVCGPEMLKSVTILTIMTNYKELDDMIWLVVIWGFFGERITFPMVFQSYEAHGKMIMKGSMKKSAAC